MAARTARVIYVHLDRGDDSNIGAENAVYKVKNYKIGIDNNGTVVTTGSDTLNAAIDTAITGANREGKTVALKAASVSRPGYDSKNAQTFTATTALSGNSVVCTIVGGSNNDWATGVTLAANAICDRPLELYVTVTEA